MKISFILLPIVLFICFLLSSCGTTKNVPDGQYRLKANKVVLTESRYLSADNIMPYIYQKPNKEMIFGLKFYLGLYNLAGKDTTKWLNRTLRNWGEPPVIFDSLRAKASLDNIKQYLITQGFYYADVRDSVIYKKKKAEVRYIVDTKEPYRLQKITYDVLDTALRNVVLADTISSPLRARRRLTTDMLETERDRITTRLRDKGYYAFNKGYITYEADTLFGNSMADLKVNIANITKIDSVSKKNTIDHKKYRINNVYIYTDYDPVELYSDPEYLQKFDTLYTRGIYLLYNRNKGLSLRSGVIPRTSLITPGGQYNESDVTQTYNNFSNLRIYKSVTIQFKELDEVDDSGSALIDCLIQLNPLKSQSAKADIEVSLGSSDLIGFSPGLHYGHRNLFNGAELLSLDFRGVFQYSFPNSKPQNSFEYNISSSISVPKFLAPISIEYFKKQIPHTKFSASYTYQQRPNYTRSVASGSFGYLWNNTSQLSYIFNPIEFNMVKMLMLDTAFYNNLKNPYLENTYKDHFVLGMSASLIYTNQNQNAEFMRRRYRRPSTYYLRANLDVGGNALSLFNSMLKYNDEDKNDTYHMIMGMRYSQYAKIDFSFIYNKPVQSRSNLVYRVVFGIGKAYGNDISLPFEKMFYAGGANSLRGWPIRGVGPGSAVSTDTTYRIPNQVADMRIEANLEYRFPLFWRFEGAGFLDVGNIWSASSKDTRPGAGFDMNFYKSIAANTGLGLRLNLVYFIARLDVGFRLHDPAQPEGQRFIYPNKWLNGGNFALNIGINYPF